ncbi:CIS tube protein [Burkholderia cenocepacia]|uniref:CIS tube protein n=1 Tax=Burkholderia cenocepacia TaxID=95486 RepID=UPI000F5B29C1|nr:hypothetical protein [Burkholderia cenocepacia]
MKGLADAAWAAYQLKKLTITRCRDFSFVAEKDWTFSAFYNPESVAFGYSAEYEVQSTLVQGENRFQRLLSGDLSFDLILTSDKKSKSNGVDAQINVLSGICFSRHGKGGDIAGEPSPILVSWGSMMWKGGNHFTGRVRSMSVTCNQFDHQGNVMLAVVKMTMKSEEPQSGTGASASNTGAHAPHNMPSVNENSSGHSLPKMADISAPGRQKNEYLSIAYSNGLDNLSVLPRRR